LPRAKEVVLVAFISDHQLAELISRADLDTGDESAWVEPFTARAPRVLRYVVGWIGRVPSLCSPDAVAIGGPVIA
jgi:hypothetical protein